MPFDKDTIRLALTRVAHPTLGTDIVSAGAVSKIAYCDGYASVRLAAAGFLALAQTLKKGEHIRVTLILQSLKGTARRALEIWALGAATLLALLSAWYACRLSWVSYQLHDVSTGNDATPLWIPQLSMAAGSVVLAIAFVDEFVLELRGERVVAASEEALHNE